MRILQRPGLSSLLDDAYAAFARHVAAGGDGVRHFEQALGAASPDDKLFIDYPASQAQGPVGTLREVLLQLLHDNIGALSRFFLPRGPKLGAVLGRADDHILRISRYPPGAEAIANHAHTDIDLVTLLPSATAPGLQVQDNGKWVPVSLGADEVAVLAGDFTELLGGRPAAAHRVLAPGRERFSTSFFVNADPDLVIEGRTVREIFEERLATVGFQSAERPAADQHA